MVITSKMKIVQYDAVIILHKTSTSHIFPTLMSPCFVKEAEKGFIIRTDGSSEGISMICATLIT